MAAGLGTAVAGLAAALLVTGVGMAARGALDLALLGALHVHVRAGIVALVLFLLVTVVGGIGWTHAGFVVLALALALATVPFLIFSAGYVPMESAVAAWLSLLVPLALFFRARQSRRSPRWVATAVAIGWPAALMALASGFYLGVFKSLGTITNILNHVHLASALLLALVCAATARRWGAWLARRPGFAYLLALAIGVPVGLTALGGRLLAARALAPTPSAAPDASPRTSLTIPSAGCGLPECHLESYQEWAVSAHRYSATNRPYTYAVARLTARAGAGAAASCGRCHDPVRAVLGERGAGDAAVSVRLSDEGVSCVACHALDSAPTPLGDGRFTLREPEVYLPDLAGSGALTHPLEIDLVYRWVKPHRANYMRPPRKQAELCAPCHQEGAAGAHGLDTYATWQASGLAAEGIGCRECHMHMFELDWAHPPWDHHTLGRSTSLPRLVPDPSAGDPDLARAAEAARGWLDGTLEVRPSLLTYLRVMRDPQVRAYQRHYRGLPLLDVTIDGVERLRPGANAEIAVRTGSRRLGHALPALVATSAETWLALTVNDGAGRTILASGSAGERDELDVETRRLGVPRPRPGDPVDVWLASGAPAAVPGPRIQPGMIHEERFAFAVPADARPPFRVEARWRHRALAPWLAREVLGAAAVPLPIEELARAEAGGPT
ncbi:MAG: multiheme c-type cytochrome [bacterium]